MNTQPRLADLFRIEHGLNELQQLTTTRVPAGIGHVLGFHTEGNESGERWVVGLVEKLDGTLETFTVDNLKFKEPTKP